MSIVWRVKDGVRIDDDLGEQFIKNEVRKQNNIVRFKIDKALTHHLLGTLKRETILYCLLLRLNIKRLRTYAKQQYY